MGKTIAEKIISKHNNTEIIKISVAMKIYWKTFVVKPSKSRI